MSLISVEMHEEVCGKCGGVYAITERVRLERKENGGCWHCPYCQISWGYGEGENARLKRELAQEKAAHDQAKAAKNAAERESARVSDRLRRVTTRIENGVCHKCNRHFRNVARHMKTKHSRKEPKWATASREKK